MAEVSFGYLSGATATSKRSYPEAFAFALQKGLATPDWQERLSGSPVKPVQLAPVPLGKAVFEPKAEVTVGS